MKSLAQFSDAYIFLEKTLKHIILWAEICAKSKGYFKSLADIFEIYKSEGKRGYF